MKSFLFFILGFIIGVATCIGGYLLIDTFIDKVTKEEVVTNLTAEEETARAKYVQHIIDNVSTVDWDRTDEDDFIYFESGIVKVEIYSFALTLNVYVYYDDKKYELTSEESDLMIIAFQKRYGRLW